MNLIYISPNFPPNFHQFIHALAKRSVNVLGIGEENYDALPQYLKENLTYYATVANLEDYDQVYKAAAFLISNYGRIDFVESHNEHWMLHEARLREDFNIKGPSIKQTLKIKKKSEMKKIFNSCNCPVVDGHLITTRKELDKFVKKHGYPVFAKPDVGVGAMSAYKISNINDLDKFWAEKPSQDYFVEPYIDGQLLTFDGICDQNGEIVFYTSLFSVNGAFDLVAYNEDLSYYLVRDVPKDIVEIGEKVVKKFDIKAKFFHLEFLRRRSDNKLFVLEMNCRPPGGYTVDLMNYSTDVDVYAEWANIIVDNKFYANIDRKYYAAHIARKHNKHYVYNHMEIVEKFKEKVAAHLEVPIVFAEVMGNEAFICRSPDRNDIYEMIEFIQKKA